MSKYNYKIEMFDGKTWVHLPSFDYHPLQFLLGHLNCYKNYAPRNAMRVVRDDGRVIDECQADPSVHIGIIAGFPTSSQYERAGLNALKIAKQLKERESNDYTYKQT